MTNNQSPTEEGSEYDRLFYPFLFEGGTSSLEDVLAQVRHSTAEKCREIVALRQTTLASCSEEIVAAGTAMAQAFANGATLFAFGNGGSTTDAQDLVADLAQSRVRHGECEIISESDTALSVPHSAFDKPLPAIALTNDIAVLTAVGNDVGFDNVFARQIIAFGRPGDIAVGISTSGNSTNVLVALEQAKKQGLLTIGLAGGLDGGKMARPGVVDYSIVAASDHIPRIQEAQATVYHALLEVIWSLLASD